MEDRPLAQAVARFRRAASNLRRNNADAFGLARSQKVLNAFDANRHEMSEACETLRAVHRPDVVDALYGVHNILKRLPAVVDGGREAEEKRLRIELRAWQGLIRSAIEMERRGRESGA